MSQALLDAIREEAKPALWANGVKLARGNAVALEKQQGKEFVFRVKPPNRPVAHTVYLTPDDSWECSCDSPVDPCDHVVAAAIILAQGVTTVEVIKAISAAGLKITPEILVSGSNANGGDNNGGGLVQVLLGKMLQSNKVA